MKKWFLGSRACGAGQRVARIDPYPTSRSKRPWLATMFWLVFAASFATNGFGRMENDANGTTTERRGEALG